MEDTRLESFPFDSKRAGTDDYGYPIYDRAVGASMLRQTFAKFFSNGVFDTPPSALEISKGIGLKVNIAEGIAIINGAMASVPEGGTSVSLTDETITAGTYAYGVFLRYDENIDKRSCYITVRKGEAGASPTPPEPERSAPGIWELRLGYVVVPTGATDLSGATVTNEKGLEFCPFAAPFEEIDVSGITADFRVSANEALDALLDYFNQYKDMVAAAVDETLAGQLQTQINQLKEQLDSFDLSGSVDDKTVEYTQEAGEIKKTLKLKNEGVATENLANGSVTAQKMSPDAIVFTDDPSSEGDSSGRFAATPKCVDQKIAAPKNSRVTQNYGTKDQGTINFNSENLNVEGFSISSDGLSLIANASMFVFARYKHTDSSNRASVILINETEVFKYDAYQNDISFIVFMEKGDNLKIQLSSSASASDLTIQGV